MKTKNNKKRKSCVFLVFFHSLERHAIINLQTMITQRSFWQRITCQPWLMNNIFIEFSMFFFFIYFYTLDFHILNGTNNKFEFHLIDLCSHLDVFLHIEHEQIEHAHDATYKKCIAFMKKFHNLKIKRREEKTKKKIYFKKTSFDWNNNHFEWLINWQIACSIKIVQMNITQCNNKMNRARIWRRNSKIAKMRNTSKSGTLNYFAFHLE